MAKTKLSVREMKKTLAGHKLTLEVGQRQYGNLQVECNGLKERLKLVAAENETLRQDIRWYKSLIQNLVPGKGPNGQPR